MISSNNQFKINQRLEIAPVGAIEYFSSRIEDFRGEDLVVAFPMRNSIPVSLPIGEKLYGKAIAEEGVLYSFESSLLAWMMNPIPLWVIRKPENIKQIQQRNFFRYGLTLPVRYFLIDENGLPIENTESVTVSKNLSGGGLLIVSNKRPLPIGTKLWLEIPLTEQDTIRTLARVSRSSVRELTDGSKLFLTGLQFIGMDETIRKKIINFLNAKMLERRSRGIL